MKSISVAIFVLVLALSACSPAATPAPHAPVAPTQPPAAQAPAQPAASGITEAPAPTLAPNATPNTSPGNPDQLAYAPAGSSMVVKDAKIHLLVDETDRAIAQTMQVVADNGGYIISAQSWYQDGYKHATLRLGVPAAIFEKTLNAVRGLALKVTEETASGQDVSAEYVDLQSRLTNLEATAARTRDFLKSAKTLDETFQVNQKLADLEAQMEQIKGQMNFYQGRSTFSTLTVEIEQQAPVPTPTFTATPTSTPTQTPTPTSTPAWNPGTTFQKAGGILTSASQGMADVLIWIIVLFGPVIIVGGLILTLVKIVLRNRKSSVK